MTGSEDSRSDKDSAEIGYVLLLLSAVGVVAFAILLVQDLISLEVLGWGILLHDLIPLAVCLAILGWYLKGYIKESRSEPKQDD